MDFEQLKKILELERARGFDDKAVFGGLDRLLGRWTGELPHGASIPHYSHLNNKQREDWINTILGLSNAPDNAAPLPSDTRKENTINPVILQSPITTVKGISSKLSARFEKLGVTTIRDMLYFFPRRHIDYSKVRNISQLELGVEQTVIGVIWQATQKTIGRRIKATEAIIGDETGNIKIVWFNQPYLVKKLVTNKRLAVSGKVRQFMNQKQFESPEYELLESDDLIHTGRLIPVYPLTEGLNARTVRRIMKDVVERWAPALPDFLPAEVLRRATLLNLSDAISQSHYPDSELSKDDARRRLAFDELFLIQLGVLAKKREWQDQQQGYSFTIESSYLEKFLSILPYDLTLSQKRVLDEILNDLACSKPMSRLLQGDVGSGKTVVALAAMIMTVANGYQAAFMAPTEILAEQHFNNICNLLSGSEEAENGIIRTFSKLLPVPITVSLLTGSTKKNERKDIYNGFMDGNINIAIGTHALIQEGIDFKHLGLAIVDEQHRFGVMQRAELRQKGISPHLLVMSATPIPRTLALTIYGDLDISVIDTLPPGRQKILTKLIGSEQRSKAFEFVRKQIISGHQAFIICPLIEESEAIDAKAAVTEYQRLSSEVFPEFNVGLLHGRLSSAEKEDIMRQFRAGDLHILVSTSVVEVGIDVPNATVMLVEGADRFGLSQLHQFRGRVGRGSEKSYCILLSEKPSLEAKERLEVMEKTDDGFALAEEDLRLRGAGEFFGTRQSGLPDLRMAKLSDRELLELARKEAIRLFDDDPNLTKHEHKLLALEVNKLWQNVGELS